MGRKSREAGLYIQAKNNTLYCFCCKLFSQKNDHLISSGLNYRKNCSELFEIFCSGTYSIHKSTFVCRGYSYGIEGHNLLKCPYRCLRVVCSVWFCTVYGVNLILTLSV